MQHNFLAQSNSLQKHANKVLQESGFSTGGRIDRHLTLKGIESIDLYESNC